MSEEIIDLSEFMDRVQDDKELLVELLDIFMEDFEQKRKPLQEAVEKKDFEEVKNICHSLKGASGNISAKPLRETLLKIEEMGKNNDFTGVDDLLINMDKHYEDLTTRIATVKEELKS